MRKVTVIRLVRCAPAADGPGASGRVAALHGGYVVLEEDASITLIVEAVASPGRGHVIAENVTPGDILHWVGEPYGAVWIAEQTESTPRARPEEEEP